MNDGAMMPSAQKSAEHNLRGAAGEAQRHRITRRELLRVAAALSGLGFGGLMARPAQANALRVGEPAPPAILTRFDGGHVSTADLLGNVVVLTFWATWCVPCRDELPLLSAYAAQHATQGLRVLGFCLNTPDQLAEARTLAQQLSFPSGLLANADAPGYGRIWRIPVNFTIDRQGRLVDDGWKDAHPVWTQERLERIVTPLLTAAA
jgi:cytochrome c biogenesis protein CcmG/thiol:disulfide interchange protein DsbE